MVDFDECLKAMQPLIISFQAGINVGMSSSVKLIAGAVVFSAVLGFICGTTVGR